MTIILFIIYFIIKYYFPNKLLSIKKDINKYKILIVEIVVVLLIFFIGEKVLTKYFIKLDLISNEILSAILFVIVILKPVNEKFKTFFGDYAPKKVDKKEDTIDGAVGLVFTEKSVTRFEKISKEPSFAEYYLIGSLYSMICVLALYYLIV